MKTLDTTKLPQSKDGEYMKKIIIIAVAILSILAVIVALWSPVIFQCGNPIPYLLAATKISDETPYVQVKVDDSASI